VDASIIARHAGLLRRTSPAWERSALFAARAKRLVDMDDFERAKDKVIMAGAEVHGHARGGAPAYHEAGHAIVARLLPKTDPGTRSSSRAVARSA
jgi:cell division protease FtsH